MQYKSIQPNVALACILCAAISGPSLAQQIDVAKWSTCDIPISVSGTSSNWYTDEAGKFTATFTGPGGVSQTVPGFWNGDNNFVLRFTPTVEGAWSYTTTSTNPQLNNLTGSLNAQPAAPTSHGFLRVDPQYKNSFVWDDGTRYFMMGQTYYDWLNGAMANDNWKTSVDSMLEYGFTKVRFNVYANNVPGETNVYADQIPYLGTPTAPDRDRLNFAYWQKLDEMVAYMDEKGLVADLIITTPYGTTGQNNIQFGTDDQNSRFVQYVVNRYSAYDNVIWCVGQEWEKSKTMSNNPQTKEDYTRLGEIVRYQDPWIAQGDSLRPLSIHGLQIYTDPQGRFQFFNTTWPTYAVIQYSPQSGYEDPADNLALRNNTGHNMPVANDEFKYIGQLSRFDHRAAMWSIATAGGYSSTADFRQNPSGTGIPETTGDWTYQPEYGDIKRLVDFFTTKDIEYWKMSSHNELVEGIRTYVLADPGHQYVLYAAVGGEFSLTLSPGSYEARLYDPQTGADALVGHIVVANRPWHYTMPNNDDWVLYLTEMPEPSTLVMFAAASIASSLYLRRRTSVKPRRRNASNERQHGNI